MQNKISEYHSITESTGIIKYENQNKAKTRRLQGLEFTIHHIMHIMHM